MKKFIAMLLTLCFLFSFASPAFASEQPFPEGLEELGEELNNAEPEATPLAETAPAPVPFSIGGKIHLSIRGTDNQPIPGAVFDILLSGTVVETLTTNSNGIAESQELTAATYLLKEKTIPSQYISKNYSRDVVITDYAQIDIEVKYEPYVEPYRQSIRVKKTDDSGNTLQGVVFGVYRTNDSKIEEITTGADGTATSSPLEVGDYYLKELQGLSGYEMDTAKKSFHIPENEPIQTITVVNPKIPEIKGKVFISIKNDIGNVLPGAVFGVYTQSGNKLEELTADTNGKTSSTLLNAGSYYVQQVSAPEGYLIDNQRYNFTIERDRTEHTFDIVNTRISGKVKIIKTGASNQSLQGVVFKIHDANTNSIIGELTTGNDGTAISEKLFYGKYYLKESVAADGYEINPNPVAFSIIEHEKTVEMRLTNNLIMGSIKVIKTDGTDGKRLQNAVFDLFNGQGQKVTTLTTNSNGEAIYSNLPKGEYSLKEVTAPEGYALSTSVVGFSITSQGQMVEKTISNIKGYGTLEITKNGENGTKLENVSFDIFKKGSSEKVSTITTGSAGKASVVLPLGKYELKETKTHEDYLLLDKPVECELKENGAIVPLTIENKKKPVEYGYIKLTKTEEADASKKLSGAVFGFYKDNTSEKVMEITSGTDGTVTSGQIPTGKYYLLEQKAPEGYALNETKYPVTVEKEKTSEITITNKLLPTNKGTLQIMKTDKDNKLLQGAVFIVLDAQNQKVSEMTTGAEGMASVELAEGKYIVQESKAPAGYKLDESKKEVTVQAGKTASLTILNEKDMDNLQIIKSAAGSGEKLQGAVFGIYREGTTDKIAEITTDMQGLASAKLEKGDYFLLELKAPTGYVPEKAKISFTISSTDQVVKIEVTNVKENALVPGTKDKPSTVLPGNVSIPKTGQKIPVMSYVASAFCFLVFTACGYSIVHLRKKGCLI